MSEAAYPVVIHVRARAEFDALQPDIREEIRERVTAVSEQREPTSKPYVKALKHKADDVNLFAVRVGEVRVVCTFDKPQIRVLLVDKRRVVYDRLDVAVTRAGEVRD